MYAVIVENDKSDWEDETGVRYHFPKRYLPLLPPGTQVIYYKGSQKDSIFAARRLTKGPHYFGVARISKVYADPQSVKGDYFADIEGFVPFDVAVGIRAQGATLEEIPPKLESNFWRYGVRPCSADVFARILSLAGITAKVLFIASSGPAAAPDDELESGVEGKKSLRYVTKYERDPENRRLALLAHGYRCRACGVDMGERYGPYAAGLIHVHHVVPVSKYGVPKKPDPVHDLVPLCPNCHSVVHRQKDKTLSVAELQVMLAESRLS